MHIKLAKKYEQKINISTSLSNISLIEADIKDEKNPQYAVE